MKTYHYFFNYAGYATVIVVQAENPGASGPLRELYLFASLVLENPPPECVIKDRYDFFNRADCWEVLTIEQAVAKYRAYRQEAETMFKPK